MKIVLTAVLLLCLSWQSKSVITAIQPEDLFKNTRYLFYNLAKFGEVDYRKKETYQVVLASPEDACSFLERPTEGSYKLALLIKDGGCSYSRKSSTAFSIGVSLAIVTSSTDAEPDDLKIPVPDGKMTKFNAPLILIGKADGKKMHDYLSNPSNPPLLLSVDFDSVDSNDQVFC